MKRLAYSDRVRELILDGTLSYGEICAAIPGCTRAYVANTKRLMRLPNRKPGRRKGYKATPAQLQALSHGAATFNEAQQDAAWERAKHRLGSAA